MRKVSYVLNQTLCLKSWSFLMILTLSCNPCLAESTPMATLPAIQLQPTHINVNEIKSPKGITAWIVESHDIPVISVALAFKGAGMAADPKGKSGLAHLLSGMLDEGAGPWTSQEFKKFLAEKNIELSISTSQDTFQISFRTVKKSIGDAFQVLHTILTQPRFDHKAIVRVKNQILTILEQSLHSEQFIATQKLQSLLYGNHPYGMTAQQTLKEFPKITAEEMRQFMKERLSRDQLLISAVGDITEQELKTYIDKTLGDLPEKATPSHLRKATLHNLGTTTIETLDIPQSIVFFAQSGICRNHPDFYAVFLMMKIMGDGEFESRLWNEIREKRGLAYGIDADLNWSQYSSLVLGGTATNNKTVKEAVNIIRKVWQDMRQGATQAELDFIKKRMMGGFALNFSSTLKIAKALLIYQIDNLGADYINKRNSFIAAVTLDDINRVAQSFLKPEQLTFVIVGQPEGFSASNSVQNSLTGNTQRKTTRST